MTSHVASLIPRSIRPKPRPGDVVILNPEELLPDNSTILSRSCGHVRRFLQDARETKARLEFEIADRQEKLRQTVIAIEAFEVCEAKLADGEPS